MKKTKREREEDNEIFHISNVYLEKKMSIAVTSSYITFQFNWGIRVSQTEHFMTTKKVQIILCPNNILTC